MIKIIVTKKILCIPVLNCTSSIMHCTWPDDHRYRHGYNRANVCNYLVEQRKPFHMEARGLQSIRAKLFAKKFGANVL